jgi:aspartate/glutamate racemase
VKTIGLIGGMSWESSIEYYRIINQVTKSKLGGLHSAKSVMYSVNFAEIESLQHQSRWQEAAIEPNLNDVLTRSEVHRFLKHSHKVIRTHSRDLSEIDDA